MAYLEDPKGNESLAAQHNDEKSSLHEAGQNIIYPALQQAALAATTFSLLNQYETDHHPDSRLNLADFQKLNVRRSLCERLHNMYPNMHFLPNWLIQPPPLSPTLWPGILPTSNNNSNNNNNDKQNNNNNNNMNDNSERRDSKKNVTKKKSAKTSATQDPPNDDPANSSTANRSSGTKRDGKQRSFICRTCNRGFAYKHVLQNHERTHTGEKPFECPHCKKRFTRDHHLKTHLRLHTGEKPYQCEHCDRQFVQVANLRRHLRVHTGERPYKCSICSAKFSDSNQLKAHALIHKGQKPFECQHCQTRFRRRHHLMNHKCAIASNNAPRLRNVSPLLLIDNKPDERLNSDENESAQKLRVIVQRSNMLALPLRMPNQVPNMAVAAPLSSPKLAGIPKNFMPDDTMQTEPEDLSMSTGRSLYRSSSKDSLTSPGCSRSSSSDIPQDENDEKREDLFFGKYGCYYYDNPSRSNVDHSS